MLATSTKLLSPVIMFCGGKSTSIVIVPLVYPVPPEAISAPWKTPPNPSVAVATAVPLLNVTSGDDV